ncbi:MAG: hypothetical protein WKF83_02905 [Nocardioidaceae bacterium]
MAAALLITGNAEVWSLAAIEAVNGTVAAFTFPAMTSVVPMVVERDQLQQSNALLNFTRTGTFIAGPSIAAGIVVTAGSGWAIAVDGVCFLISALCMSRLHLPRMARAEATSMIHDLREGWNGVRRPDVGLGRRGRLRRDEHDPRGRDIHPGTRHRQGHLRRGGWPARASLRRA